MASSRVGKQYHFIFSWKSLAKAGCFLVLLASLFFIVNHFKTANYFPIKTVKIVGVQHIEREAIQQLLTPMVKKSFFAVDVSAIKERLLQIPWTSQVVVRRIWPNELVIMITERNPIARWNENSLLSTTGELFSPPENTIPEGLPVFVGPLGQQIFMLENHAKLNSILKPLHFKITRLELSPTMAWNITLDNGMKLSVGSKDILTRLSHFVKVYPKIIGARAADVEYIDLRYTNGLAVRWKVGTKAVTNV